MHHAMQEGERLTSSADFSSTAAESRVLGDDLQRTPG